MLAHLTDRLACSRACSKAEITPAAFKAAVHLPGGDSDEMKEWRKWFMEIFTEMDKKDR